MTDTDELAAVAGKLTSTLVSLYGGGTGALAYLPGGITVPDSLVQDGVVNDLQVQQWLATTFDSPLLVSPADATVLAKTDSSASQIYREAVTGAAAAGPADTDAWRHSTAEIAIAQDAYGALPGARPLGCQPDDWSVGTPNGYWTTFDSAAVTTTGDTTVESTAPPMVNPVLWRVRQLAEDTTPVQDQPWRRRWDRSRTAGPDLADRVRVAEFPVDRAVPGPAGQRTAVASSRVLAAAAAGPAIGLLSRRLDQDGPGSTQVLDRAEVPARTRVPDGPGPTGGDHAPARGVVRPWAARRDAATALTFDTAALLTAAPAVQQVTTDTSTASISVHLRHTRVELTRTQDGTPWWNGSFLAEPGWYVPGLPRGVLVPEVAPDPAPAADATPPGESTAPVWAVPYALVVVRDLQVTGAWSTAASTTLSSPAGTLGPLALFGSTAAQSGGLTTYSREGMQVVGVLYTPLPVLPPVDTPPT